MKSVSWAFADFFRRVQNFPSVNFINILRATFSHKIKVLCAAFLNLQFGFVTFCQNNISSKAAPKMLMKLTTWEKTICLKKPKYNIQFFFKK
jgi:hypothetical protein